MSYWHNTSPIEKRTFTCGFCDKQVGPSQGYYWAKENSGISILICPNCDRPTYFNQKTLQHPGQHPAPTLGSPVGGITDKEVESMYSEARKCSSVGAFTACVMACRKILMNVAVHLNAPEGESFQQYVNYLDLKGYIPPNGKAWVDEIRKRGNTATHEIKLMTQQDAELVLGFTEMLLKFVYEFPSRVAKPATPASSSSP